MVFQSHEKAEKCLGRNLESVEQISLLEDLESCAGQHTLVSDNLIGCEHVKTPAINTAKNLKTGKYRIFALSMLIWRVKNTNILQKLTLASCAGFEEKTPMVGTKSSLNRERAEMSCPAVTWFMMLPFLIPE